jgi:hypothetical protein
MPRDGQCVKGHPKTAGKCSSRCIRYNPRLELPRAPDGTRRFEALGGYPTRTLAEAALADALARRSHGLALDLAKLTVDQYLDRWLAHVRGPTYLQLNRRIQVGRLAQIGLASQDRLTG